MNPLRHAWVLAILGLVGIVAFGSLWYIQGELSALAQVLGLFGAGALGTWAFLDRDRIKGAVDPRQALAGASSLLVLVLAGLLGILTVALATEYDATRDISRDGRSRLSDRSLEIARGLDQDITFYVLFQAGYPERDKMERLAERFADASGRVTVEVIDPLQQPARARSVVKATGRAELDRLAESGTVVLVAGQARRRIESRFDEAAIANALVKLTSGDDRRICWSVGHGERDPDDSESLRGYGNTVNRLEDRNMVVTESRILADGVDRACEALVIAGPTDDVTPVELEAVAAYVAEGGQLLILLDNPSLEGVDSPALVEDLARYGIRVGRDAILENDPGHVVADPVAGEPLALYGPADFRSHPVLRGLSGGMALHWPRSVQATDQQPGIRVAEIVVSSERSWAETRVDLDDPNPPTPDPGEALGPVSMMVVADVLDPGVLDVRADDTPPPAPGSDTDTDTPTTPTPALLQGSRTLVPDDFAPEAGGRVIVLGDADLGGNALTSLVNNGDVLLNSLSWLLGETDQLGTDATDHETLTLSGASFATLLLLSVLFLPGGALLIGVILIVRRRFL